MGIFYLLPSYSLTSPDITPTYEPLLNVGFNLGARKLSWAPKKAKHQLAMALDMATSVAATDHTSGTAIEF